MWIWGNGNEEMKLTFFFFLLFQFMRLVGLSGWLVSSEVGSLQLSECILTTSTGLFPINAWDSDLPLIFIVISSFVLLVFWLVKYTFFFFFFGKVPKCISSVLIYILDCDSAAGVFVCLLEYPRSKRGKGTSVERTWVFYEESIWTHLRL